MKKIVFQGDSITDVGRNTERGSLKSIGQGYAMLCTARLTAKYPEAFSVSNRGVSGNRIVDVYSRIKRDCWNLSPDVLSILIGINDVWHEYAAENGVEADRFYNVYRMLVADTVERFPNIRMILMEPFVLPGRATDAHLDGFVTETALRAEAVKRIAAEFGQTFLPLQEMFTEACAIAPADYWLGDGVHPTPAGHQLIADRWLETFEREILPTL